MTFAVHFINDQNRTLYLSSWTDTRVQGQPVRFIAGYTRHREDALPFDSYGEALDMADRLLAYGGSEIAFAAPVRVAAE